jgi:hypothetical protein
MLTVNLMLMMNATGLAAQTYTGAGTAEEVYAGSDLEAYLKYVALADSVDTRGWTIRPLSPRQTDDLRALILKSPWAARLRDFPQPAPRAQFKLLPMTASVRFNSAFPYGSNDAAIWAGRGATVAVEGGIFARAGILSLRLAPILFRAQNAPFSLAPSSLPCGCGDPQYGTEVDRPQRFGSHAYQRLDPGQSEIRVDAFGMTAGFSTANEGWGPSREYPFILGNNAPGFAHFFAGTGTPFPVLIGRAHIRVIYGRLDESEFSVVNGSKFYQSRIDIGRLRFGSGAIASFEPRGIDGLEIGAARFFHSIWPKSGIPPSYLRKPLQTFLKAHLSPTFDAQISGTDNQEASLFARWSFLKSGLEVYGEYGKEDHSYDLRDFVQEPDHQRSYSLGLTKVLQRRPSSFDVLQADLINFQAPTLLRTGRGEGSIYLHTFLRQGHTNRGQLLGADVGVGAAAGSTISWNRYTPAGRTSFYWKRDLRGESGTFSTGGQYDSHTVDVIHSIGYERLRFKRKMDVTTSLTLMNDFNRNFGHDVFNLNAVLSLTLPH